MSELTLIAEQIHDAMTTLEKTQEAGDHLVENATRENFEAFRANMTELCERLRQLNLMLAHEDEMMLDELSDALGRAFNLPAPEYRRATAHG